MQRKVFAQSPAAGGLLENVQIPQGLIVAAVLRAGQASIPRGDFRLEVGDDVVLFVQQEEAPMAQLLFPGPDSD